VSNCVNNNLSISQTLVKNTFYTWVQKYQYRATRRPLLIKSLTFWGNSTIKKGFFSFKIYYEGMREARTKFRSFWCIKAVIALIDNISIYDKIVYPSQALNLPIKDFNEKQISITVDEFNKVYKQKLFKHWKTHYIQIRNKKAKIAYNYSKNAFIGWKEYIKKDKVNTNKVYVSVKKRNQKILEQTFPAMVICLKQQIALKSAYSR
jgi:hypothetical protein